MAKLWLGRFWTGEGAIAFPRATLLDKAGKAVRQDVQWWRIRRIFGFGGRRFIVAIIRVETSTIRHLEPQCHD